MRKLLLVEDDADLRFTLKYLIETTSSFQVVGEAANGEEAIAKVKELDPDVIVMDVQMPVKDGITATKEIRDLSPRVVIIGLTAFGEYPELMLGAGANVCLLKDESNTKLVTLLERLRNEAETGEPWY